MPPDNPASAAASVPIIAPSAFFGECNVAEGAKPLSPDIPKWSFPYISFRILVSVIGLAGHHIAIRHDGAECLTCVTVKGAISQGVFITADITHLLCDGDVEFTSTHFSKTKKVYDVFRGQVKIVAV